MATDSVYLSLHLEYQGSTAQFAANVIRVWLSSFLASLMHLSPFAVLIFWIPLGAYFFRRYPIRIAILVNFVAGWAILPGANYAPTAQEFPYWILGVCLPANYFLTKATATGLAGFAGMLLFTSMIAKSFVRTR